MVPVKDIRQLSFEDKSNNLNMSLNIQRFIKTAYIAMAFGVALLILSSYVCYIAISEYKQCIEAKKRYSSKDFLGGFMGVVVESYAKVAQIVAIIQAEFALIGASIIALACTVRKS